MSTHPSNPFAGAPHVGESPAHPSPAVFEHAGTGIAFAARSGAVVEANPALCRLLGYAREEMLGAHYAAFLHPDMRQVHEVYVQRLLDGEETSFELDSVCQHRDGRAICVHIFVSRIPEAEVGTACMVALIADRTRQREAELERRRSEATLRAVFDALAETVVVLDTRGRVIDANERLAPYGYSVDELQSPLSAPRQSLVRADGTPFPVDERPAMITLRTGRPVRNVEVGVRTANGTLTWHLVNTQPVHGDDGQMIGVVASMVDVTERKGAELALLESEQRLRLALDASEAATWSYDAITGTITSDTRSHERLYGFLHDEPRSLDGAVSRIHPEDRPRVLARLEQLRRETTDDDWNLVFRVVHPDGRTVWMYQVGRAQRDAQGRLTRLDGISLDITARKESEVALQQSHDALQLHAWELETRADQLRRLASELTLAEQRVKSQVARSLHDHLQQLLFGAKLTLERLRKRSRAWAADDECLLERAQADLDEAVAAARSLSVELSPPVLNDQGLPAALDWLAGWMEQKYGLQVEVDLDPGADPGRADIRTLVFECVRELLFNAVKHAQVDAATLTLRSSDAGGVIVGVSDAGVGFRPDLADAARSTSGFGLHSIRERLSLFGGSLRINSAPGLGARFVLTVPSFADAPRAAVTGLRDAQASGPTATPATHTARLRVLVVDDHASVREVLRQLLADRHELHVVGVAADGRDAIAAVRTLRPDAVVMDVSMPGMDGIEATRRILREFPGVTIVGLSTHERTEHPHAIEAAGAARYFSKADDMQKLIDHLLTLHRESAAVRDLSGGQRPS